MHEIRAKKIYLHFRLDMPHDDDVKCAAYKNRSGMHNIMSRMLDDNTFPWEWSKCSRHYVTEFLEWVSHYLDRPLSHLRSEKRDNDRSPLEHISDFISLEFRICFFFIFRQPPMIARILWRIFVSKKFMITCFYWEREREIQMANQFKNQYIKLWKTMNKM